MRGGRWCGWVWSTVLGLLLVTPGGLWAQQPKSGGTLRIAYEADITGMDPHTSLGIQAMYVEQNLFNTLVTIDDKAEYVPDLAASWEVKEGGKVYIFHLRKGVKFHDGADLTAEAVKWNFERILNPEGERCMRKSAYFPEPCTIKYESVAEQLPC